MKRKLQRILSILCILALFTGCLAFASAEEEAEKVSRVITVKWEDEDNYEGIRPDSVQMTIGGAAVTVKASEDWVAETLAGADEKWSYGAVAGYEEPFASGKEVTVVTYTHKVEKTSVTAKVAWNDNEDANGLRPASVSVLLLADGKVFRKSAAANATNGWTVTWDGLPLNAQGTRTAIQYTAEQADSMEAYATAVSGLEITNTLKTGTLAVKVTASGAPADADLSTLAATVTGPDKKQMPASLVYGNAANGEKTFTFENVVAGAYAVQLTNGDALIDAYAKAHEDSEIVYALSESSRVGDAGYVEAGATLSLNVTCAWKEAAASEPNTDPMSAAGGLVFEITGPDGYKKTVTYAEFTDGKYELDGLKPGEYAVAEKNAEGLVKAYSLKGDESTTCMTITVGKDGTGNAKLVNSYAPAPTPKPDAEVMDIPVTKIWNDDNDKDRNRPGSVTVHLYANGVLNDTAEITAANGWQHTFTEKPVTDEAGNEIAYSVNEDAVLWYDTEINGFFITNTYHPELTSASFQKVWNDNNNNQRIRPSSIAVTLLPVGKVYVLNEAGGWNVTLNDLPKYIEGKEVTYTWKEQAVSGYTQETTAAAGSAWTVTNRVTRIPPRQPGKPKDDRPGDDWTIFNEYETALGIPILINHVGDCFD